MNNFFIRTWIDLTQEDNGILTIKRSEKFEVKKDPNSANGHKTIMMPGDIAYVWHVTKQRDKEHIPGNGLYCSGIVESVNQKEIVLKIDAKIGTMPFNDDDPLMKGSQKGTELHTNLKRNCHEGYNVISSNVSEILGTYLVS